MMRTRTNSVIRIAALVISGLALLLAGLGLLPGMKLYNDANELVSIEPAFPHALALGAIGFAVVGAAVARWPSPAAAFGWIAVSAGAVALWLSEHLLDNMFLHAENTPASNIAGGLTLLGAVLGLALGVTCLVIICVRAIKQLRTPVATAP